MDATDRRIINGLQGGFPISERPYGDAAEKLGLKEDELISRIGSLRENGFISRFGPLWDVEYMGGAKTLAALSAPTEEFDRIAAIVNGFPEVAHNYERVHELNMWFVVTVDNPDRMQPVLNEIAARTECTVYDMPKLEEFFIGLHFELPETAA